MHLTDIRIDKIVDAGGLPNHARGTASFTDGKQYGFIVMFAQTYNDSRVFVRQQDQAPPQHPGGPVARAIHERLSLAAIAKRERDAIAACEQQRVAACRNLIPAAAS